MSAGREMDALVAEKVMQHWVKRDVLMWQEGRERKEEYSEGFTTLAHYSTDIADAWTVVERMVNNGYCPGLLFDDNGHWALAFDGAQSLSIGDEPDDVSTSFFVGKDLWCDTAPLAICRAVLLDAFA